MKTKIILFLLLTGFTGILKANSDIILSIVDTNAYFTILSEELKIKIIKNPWHISVYDKLDNLISGEKENGVFLFGENRISNYSDYYKELGYDTLLKRDPPFYHLFDESVIIGESVVFECNTTNFKTVKVYLTFHNPFVFSVWMTLPDIVEPVKQSFISEKNEHFFGLGECWNARSLDLKGMSVTMNNSQGTPDQGGYIPFYVSTKGYGILVDNNLKVNFDFSNSNEVTITAPPICNSEDGAGYFYGTSLLYYFYYGPDLLDVISRFTGHVSRPALPPSWALFTTWQWRDTNDEPNVYKDADGIRNEKIPCGLIWIDRPWAQGAQNMPPPFEWQTSRFPNGSEMFKDLQDKGYKTGVWVARNLYGSFSDSMNYKKLKSDTKSFIERDNCQMYKIDRGNVQSTDPLFTCQAYYEAWDNVLYGDFVTLPRTIANRAQQYVSGKWPGDNNNTYDYPSGLKANIAAMLNLAIAGFPFWGGDTGGFPDPPGNNVTVRWAQFSSFCTIFETAGTPYDYEQKYRDIFRKYAELYTRLFPYRWTYARIAHEKGHPVTRALALEYPDDKDGYNQKFEYLFGDWILVAPVVDAKFSRNIYLPAGKWYDWWDGTIYNGPKTINDYPAPEDKLPLFIKAGAIIPLIDIQQTWQNSTTDPITWRIYPEGKSNFKILGDTVIYPGKDKPYTDLKTINIECVKREAKIQIITGKFPQSFIFEVHVNVKPLSVNKNEEVIRKYDEIPDLNTINEGWYYDEDNGGIVWIKVNGSDLQSNNISLIIP
jgi:alpha-glucosidase (family GH31 glycosyl hydrolase)